MFLKTSCLDSTSCCIDFCYRPFVSLAIFDKQPLSAQCKKDCTRSYRQHF